MTTSNEYLTREQVEALLSGTRTKGEYKSVIKDHADSGEVVLNLTEKFPGKTASAIKQSVNQNISKLIADGVELPKLVCVANSDNVVFLINHDAHYTTEDEG